MALVVADRVQETTTTTGTGTVTLAGAVSGYQSFGAAIGNGNTTYYCITSGTAWEVGIGTYTAAGTTLARTTILASSAAGAAITLSGTSNVFCVYPAGKALYTDANGDVGIGTTTLTNAYVLKLLDANSKCLELANGETDATNKSGFIAASRYTNADVPFVVVRGSSSATASAVNIGGGSTTAAPATDILFLTAALTGAAGAGTQAARIDSSQNIAIGTAAPSGNGFLEIKAGTASAVPVLLTAGTNKSTAVAGGVEYDGEVFYHTNDTTSGRGYAPATQIFRLTANGTAIGPAINNFFGANSAIQLAAGAEYEIEAYCYFTKTTAGAVTITATTSLAPVNLNGVLLQGPSGVGPGAVNQMTIINSTATGAAFAASASLSTGANYLFQVRLIVEANASASNLRINVTSGAGTVTPLRGSYYKVTRLPPGNSGLFAA